MVYISYIYHKHHSHVGKYTSPMDPTGIDFDSGANTHDEPPHLHRSPMFLGQSGVPGVSLPSSWQHEEIIPKSNHHETVSEKWKRNTKSHKESQSYTQNIQVPKRHDSNACISNMCGPYNPLLYNPKINHHLYEKKTCYFFETGGTVGVFFFYLLVVVL